MNLVRTRLKSALEVLELLIEQGVEVQAVHVSHESRCPILEVVAPPEWLFGTRVVEQTPDGREVANMQSAFGDCRVQWRLS